MYCLIVDDDEDCLFIGQKIVGEMGFSTRIARSGEEALEICMRKLPQAILLDWSLPGMDGLTFLEKLKRLNDGYKVTIVMSTGHSEEKKVKEALASGVKGYLIKPFTKEDIARQFAYLRVKPERLTF